MDTECGLGDQVRGPWKNYKKHLFILAYQSCGVVYGDVSTSPLYVLKSTFTGSLSKYQDEDTVFGIVSLIFWTLTLIPLLKYVLIVLSADDNGEGGTFALYSLLCRHAKLSLLPNQQAADEELSTYYAHRPSRQAAISAPLRRFLEKHEKSSNFLLLLVLFGASMVIADSIFTPTISVISSISGLRVQYSGLTDSEMVAFACAMLVCLFAMQHWGTHRVAFMFAPIVIIWLSSIAAIGIFNTFKWNPRIFLALSPHYIVKFFRGTGTDGWISLGGILLSITGAEAMFADLGHFTAASIRVSFIGLVYPCLVLQYMGQGAFLSKNFSAAPAIFFESIPGPVFWPVFVIATLAAVVASQAVITATFSIVRQCHALGCFPRVKIVHTSRWIFGQVYIPEINWILMILCVAVTLSFDVDLIGNAYGMAFMTVIFVTTWLMTLIIVFVWGRGILTALAFLLFFGSIELIYLSSSIMKFSQGGWLPLVLCLIFGFIMYTWHYGTRRKYQFELDNKVSMKWILTLGPSLGIVRVPGIGLIYTELVSGVPPIFSHFVTNLPAFHQILVFVCVKSVPVPLVPPEERYLIGRIGPREYKMYRCIVRYGYMEAPKEEDNFEDLLVISIAEYIQMEAAESSSEYSEASSNGRMAVIPVSDKLNSRLVIKEVDDSIESAFSAMSSNPSEALQTQQSVYEEESPNLSRRRHIRFELPEDTVNCDPKVREELTALLEAKQIGVAYIMGNAYVKAKKTSSLIKKFAIDVVYSFIRRNCRGPEVALDIPHISLIEVGMIYYV